MTTVTVSSKYQIVIPKVARKNMKIKPGQKLQLIQAENKLEFIPLMSIKEARGILKGMNTDFEREKDRV
jgi:AbrB family looped-hinge helix DNA binding protein